MQIIRIVWFIIKVGFVELFQPKHHCNEDHVILKASQNKHLSPYIHLYSEIVNLQDVNADMLAFVEKLKKAGHIVVLASNIGPKTLTCALNDETPLRNLLSHFDALIFPRCFEKLWFSKPHEDFYRRMHACLEIYKIPLKKSIFIDNLKTNCTYAIKSGFQAHVFKTFKKFIHWIDTNYPTLIS